MKITAVSALLTFALLFIIRVILKCKKPLSKTLYGIITGILVLSFVHIIGRFINIDIPISVMSIGISSVAGVPGVIMILLLNIITK